MGVHRLTIRREGRVFDAFLAAVPAREFENLSRVADDFLATAERDYFRGLRFPRRRESYLLGRRAAKLALGEYLREPGLNKLEVYSGVFQQPMVRYAAAEPPGVSVSHCGKLAVALAFPIDHPMALDVEEIDAERCATIQTQMSAWERQRARGGEAAESSLSTMIWTAKEALSKALKCGLMSPIEILGLSELQTLLDNSWTGLYQNFPQYKFLAWSNASLAFSIVLPKKSNLDPTPAISAMLKGEG